MSSRRMGSAALLSIVGCAGRPVEVPPPEPIPATSIAEEPAAPPANLSRLAITIRPVCVKKEVPEALDMTVTFDASIFKGAPAKFRIGNGNDAEALRQHILAPGLSDAEGSIPFTTKIAVGEDKETRLFLEGERPAHGEVALRYRVTSVSTAEKGIRFGLRHDDFGIGGTGDGFMVLPVTRDPLDIEVRWKFENCPSTFNPVGALGMGNGPLKHRAPPDALRQAGFFFGSPDTSGILREDVKINLYMFGKPNFDISTAARFIWDVFDAQRYAFGDESTTPFYAFMRVLPQMEDKVTGGGNPFGYTSVVGPAAPWNARMRNHIAHELIHHWIGVGLWVRDADGVSGYWLSEGLTVHYARSILLRARLIPSSEFLDEINKHAAAYYGNPHRGATNAAIERGVEDGTGDPSLGLLPYYRGGFFGAELDGAIREASKGTRSLDHVMRELFALAKAGTRNAAGYAEISEDAVREAIVKELGQGGGERFDAVIRRGEIARPGANAFGPCFARRDKRYGKLDGYEWTRIPEIDEELCKTIEAPPRPIRF